MHKSISLIFTTNSINFLSYSKNIKWLVRRSNEVAPDAGDGVNQGGSESDRDKQGDCQRAKQVPMNPPAGT